MSEDSQGTEDGETHVRMVVYAPEEGCGGILAHKALQNWGTARMLVHEVRDIVDKGRNKDK